MNVMLLGHALSSLYGLPEMGLTRQNPYARRRRRGDAFTQLKTEPGPDVAPIHDRQIVVLERADWLVWLDLAKPEAELLRPLPSGSFVVEQVR